MENNSILLLDNTSPRLRALDDESLSRAPTSDLSRSGSKRWTRPSVRGELARRKYAKWQPHRLGITDDGDDAERLQSDERDLSLAETNTITAGAPSLTTASSMPTVERQPDTEQMDFAPLADVPAETSDGHTSAGPSEHQRRAPGGAKSNNELDILYENQRGWFFFGIPLYSQRSLLNFDPATWVTHDYRDSAVNITNAQLPDPSWEWAWRTWYVDMSGDVDDQGWQYSFSFGSSAWHGSHPWFHSFVRRRRWVRLRVKRASERSRRGRTEFEMSHMLNEDYFTIHSGKKKRASSSELASRAASGYLSRATTKVEEEAPLDEIGNIPTLMYALKSGIVDREKIDALRRFIEEGDHELYYLNEKIPEIMPLFVFQASRWQCLTHLVGVVEELSQKISEAKGKDAEEMQRKKDYLVKAAESISHHLQGPDVVGHQHPETVTTDMLDLTPSSRDGSLLSRHLGKFSFKPMDDGGPIKGIPRAAEVGREGHIYQYSS